MPNILNYQEGKPFAFISYSSKDKSTISEDVMELQKRGVNIWFDAYLTVGIDWFNKEIKPKILQCKVVLFYASQNSIQSKQVLKELDAAKGKKPIIPICIPPLNTTIADYVNENSHKLTIDIETAYEISDKISRDNTFIPHKSDADYYRALIEKGLKRLAPGTICADIMFPDGTSPVSTPESAPVAPTPTSVDAPTPVKEKAVVPLLNHPVAEVPTAVVPTLTAPSVKIDTVSPNSAKDNKRKFKEWFMKSGKSEYTANNYTKQLGGELVRGLGLGDAVSENLFEYGDACGFEQVLEVIRGGGSATESLQNSLIAYSDFLKALSAPVSLQPDSAEIVCKHTVTNTDVSYRIIRFKKSSNICKLLPPNKKITLRYGDIVHKTKVHSVEMGRISSVPFMRNMLVGKELIVTFDGGATITLTDVPPQNQGKKTEQPESISASSNGDANQTTSGVNEIEFSLFGEQYTVTKLKDFMVKSVEVVLTRHPRQIDTALDTVSNLSIVLPPVNKPESYFRANQAVIISGRQIFVGTSFGTADAVRKVKDLLKAVGCDKNELVFKGKCHPHSSAS